MSHDPSFREVQRFRQRWLWVLLGVVALVSGGLSWLLLAAFLLWDRRRLEPVA